MQLESVVALQRYKYAAVMAKMFLMNQLEKDIGEFAYLFINISKKF